LSDITLLGDTLLAMTDNSKRALLITQMAVAIGPIRSDPVLSGFMRLEGANRPGYRHHMGP
jgi:hypothetical protein